jgi:hypothetical protein
MRKKQYLTEETTSLLPVGSHNQHKVIEHEKKIQLKQRGGRHLKKINRLISQIRVTTKNPIQYQYYIPCRSTKYPN